MSDLTKEPCPRCLELAQEGVIDVEMVQRLPVRGLAPLGHDGKYCCYDCQSADNLRRVSKGLDFVMARIAVGSDRREQYRRPGVPVGLVGMGIVRPSESGDLDAHYDWLKTQEWYLQLTREAEF